MQKVFQQFLTFSRIYPGIFFRRLIFHQNSADFRRIFGGKYITWLWRCFRRIWRIFGGLGSIGW